MLQREHSAKLSTFIELPFVIKYFVLSIFERPFYTGFTVVTCQTGLDKQYCYSLLLGKAFCEFQPYYLFENRKQKCSTFIITLSFYTSIQVLIRGTISVKNKNFYE